MYIGRGGKCDCRRIVPADGSPEAVLWPQLALPGLLGTVGRRTDGGTRVAQPPTHHRDDPVMEKKVEPTHLLIASCIRRLCLTFLVIISHVCCYQLLLLFSTQIKDVFVLNQSKGF